MVDMLHEPVQIPIESGRFQLALTSNAKGEIRLTDGHRGLRLTPERFAAAPPTIKLIAPTLSESGTTLRFYDPEDSNAGPKPAFSVPLGTTDLTVTAEAVPEVRLFVTDEATGARLDGASVYGGTPGMIEGGQRLGSSSPSPRDSSTERRLRCRRPSPRRATPSPFQPNSKCVFPATARPPSRSTSSAAEISTRH